MQGLKVQREGKSHLSSSQSSWKYSQTSLKTVIQLPVNYSTVNSLILELYSEVFFYVWRLTTLNGAEKNRHVAAFWRLKRLKQDTKNKGRVLRLGGPRVTTLTNPPPPRWRKISLWGAEEKQHPALDLFDRGGRRVVVVVVGGGIVTNSLQVWRKVWIPEMTWGSDLMVTFSLKVIFTLKLITWTFFND